MKKYITIAVVMMALVAQSFAAFVAPTAKQIAAAAKDPTELKALLKDATPKQAAAVVNSVLAVIAAQGLTPAAQKTAIDAVIAQAVAAMPGKGVAFSVALGKAMKADSVTAALAPTVSAALTQAGAGLVGSGGAPGTATAMVKAFNGAVNLPPVASGYDVQKLK